MIRGLVATAALLAALGAPAPGQEDPAAPGAGDGLHQPIPAPPLLTLSAAFERALSGNLAVASARHEVGAAEADRDLTFSFLTPRVELHGSLTRNSEEVRFGEPPDDSLILPEDDWAYQVVLTQPIFAGRREARAYRQAKLGIESARHGLRGTEDDVLLRVAADYLLVLGADGQIAVEEGVLDVARARLRQAEAFYRAGESTRVDVLRAETSIKESERRLVAVRQFREAAAGRLRVDLVLEGPVAVQEPAALTPPLPGEEELLRAAEAGHPEILQARENLEIATLEVKKQFGVWWPVLFAEVGWNAQKTPFPTDEWGYAALNLSVPVFRGKEIPARIHLARERESQAALRFEEARIRVRERVRTSLLDLEADRANLRLVEEQVSAAEEEYRQVSELYRYQEATSLEADTSESTLRDARRALVTARLQIILSELRVWHAAGSLRAAIFQGVPR